MENPKIMASSLRKSIMPISVPLPDDPSGIIFANRPDFIRLPLFFPDKLYVKDALEMKVDDPLNIFICEKCKRKHNLFMIYVEKENDSQKYFVFQFEAEDCKNNDFHLGKL